MSMSTVLRFVVAILATWRLTHLLAKEDGPWDIFARIRDRLGEGFWGTLMDCFKCLSVWIAAPLAFFVGRSVIEIIVSWLAISGGAILLEEHIREPFEFELGEEEDGLLRSEAEENTENHIHENNTGGNHAKDDVQSANGI